MSFYLWAIGLTFLIVVVDQVLAVRRERKFRREWDQ